MPRASQAARLLPPAAVVAGTAAAVLAGAFGWRWACAVALVVSLLGESVLPRWAPAVATLLNRVETNRLVRTALRYAAVLAVSRSGGAPASVTTAVAVTVGALLAVLAADAGLSLRMRYRRTPAIETRNVSLDRLRIPPAPPSVLVSPAGWPRQLLEAVALVPAALATTASPVWAAGGLAVLGALAIGVAMELASRRIGGRLGHAAMVQHVQRFLSEHRPRVVLYFSGTADSTYQVNMWLATLERLPQPAAVVLRERSVLANLATTSTPVICVPTSTDLMALDLASVRVGLFTANVGKNIHLLREPGLMTTFVGHGDSDKNASFNPVTKGFDEVWVAGPAGRERYRRAKVGVRDEQVVEVGRPQLDVLEPVRPRPDGWVPTILYAPTWEGWNAEQEYCSIASIGPLLVQALLEWPDPVRLIYRPHPFTGQRDKAMAAADRRITELLARANDRMGASLPPYQRHHATTWSTAGDAADRARDAGPGSAPSAVEAEVTAAREDAEWFRRCPPAAHLVVRSTGPSLFACFDEADLLVTDISSVLSDFLASGKPYAVCNPSQASAKEFVTTFPSAGAAILLDRHGDGVSRVLSLVTGVVPDVDAPARRALAADLLGPGPGRATERFAAAVDALAAQAEARVAARTVDVSGETEDEDAPGAPGDSSPEGTDDAIDTTLTAHPRP
jgi:hypothetical protein